MRIQKMKKKKRHDVAHHVNPLQLLNDMVITQESVQKRLMHVLVLVNGQVVIEILDNRQ